MRPPIQCVPQKLLNSDLLSATKLQSFEGRMFFVMNGQKQSADHAGLEIRIGDKVIETVVGKGGEFYLENLPTSRLPSRVFSKGNLN